MGAWSETLSTFFFLFFSKTIPIRVVQCWSCVYKLRPHRSYVNTSSPQNKWKADITTKTKFSPYFVQKVGQLCTALYEEKIAWLQHQIPFGQTVHLLPSVTHVMEYWREGSAFTAPPATSTSDIVVLHNQTGGSIFGATLIFNQS